jgi:hypothetical protein
MVEPAKKLLKQEQVDGIFGGIEDIFHVNSAFLGRLRERMKAWDWSTPIADLFLHLVQYFFYKFFYLFCRPRNCPRTAYL